MGVSWSIISKLIDTSDCNIALTWESTHIQQQFSLASGFIWMCGWHGGFQEEAIDEETKCRKQVVTEVGAKLI